jgi:hypothetical protein
MNIRNGIEIIPFGHDRWFPLTARNFLAYNKHIREAWRLTSCTKEIEIDTHEFEQKIVVKSIFGQDKPFTFLPAFLNQIQQIKPIFEI